MRAVLFFFLIASVARAEVPSEWLVIERVDERGRRPFNPDRVFLRYLLDPDSPPPMEGDEVGDKAWKKVAVNEKDFVQGRYAYAYATLESPEERIVLARVRSGGRLYVNGDGFVGDIYGMGHGGVPILLRKGTNHLFVRGMRGRFRLELDEVAEGPQVAARDPTLPDLVVGKPTTFASGALVVLNASRSVARELEVHIDADKWSLKRIYGPATIVPLGVRKLNIGLQGPRTNEAGEQTFQAWVPGTARRTFKLHVKESDAVRRVTLCSRIDGSWQEYSVRPPTGNGESGVILTLHGAGVDALNQARSYSPKEDFWIVAPTNRRPFGFDWQDWGRLDAYEVLAHFLKTERLDTDRIYLTGHSMGGHGTWHLAANDADRFVAIAPSAGWCSFDTYGGRPKDRFTQMWQGADGASLTLNMISNLAQIPTFILHGTKDDNVPLCEAKAMEKALRDAGATPEVHYQEGAGHWWNGKAAKGVDCVDWPGIFDLFRKSKKVRDPDEIDFVTADPGVDADHHWIRIEQQLAWGIPSRLKAKRTADEVVIEPTNVRRFRVKLQGGARLYRIGRQKLRAPADAWFFRDVGGWVVAPPVPGEKRPARMGPFKRAFDNQFVFVYGRGDAEGMKRARFDAQMWWYRANGDIPVMSDEEFLASRRGNVILYGNATSNKAFQAVLPKTCPVRVEAGRISVGKRNYAGESLGCLFVYPRKDDADALVGVVGHTGRAGARLGYTLLPFVSGVGYPDYAVFGPEFLEGGEKLKAAGWFDHEWRLPEGGGDPGK